MVTKQKKPSKKEVNFTRSSTYRKKYLKKYSAKNSITFCAYCGKPIRISEMTVDHIVPIEKVKTRKSARMFLQMRGIRNVNDEKNLTASCKTCNQKKGTKMGVWVILGLLSHHKWFWVARYTFRIGIVIFLLVTLAKTTQTIW